MINGDLVHPEILKALASMGHYSKVLVVDANFPVATHTSDVSTRVFLNYAPGILDVPTVLKPLLQTVAVEAAAAVVPDNGNEPPVFADYRRLLLLCHKLTLSAKCSIIRPWARRMRLVPLDSMST